MSTIRSLARRFVRPFQSATSSSSAVRFAVLFALSSGWVFAPPSFVRAQEKPAADEPAPSPAQLDHFEKKIRPVLVAHCYQCHSESAEKSNQLKGGLRVDSRAALRLGGDSGPAVVPGKLDESLLLAALKYEAFEMPPKGKLPDSVIADFETWIRDGAADPRRDGAPIKKAGIDIEAGRKFWAYQPPRRATPPAPASTAHGPIDAWIDAGLAAKRLVPAPAAPRGVLVRRLYFDLIGLPPTPEEIDEFVADDRPDAVERLADRLLASPRFGERWARHWLDVARYGESLTLRGFVLPEAWRYRDYVIETFNHDRPFDRFMQEQVAGDLLPAESIDEQRRNRIATTFLTLGNTNLEEQDKQQLRMDVVDEQLEAIGKGFLAQTLGCARCHDHKFDPIPTRDYYALAGILRSTRTLEHANVSKWLEFPLPVDPQAEAAFQKQEGEVAALQQRIKAAKEAVKLVSGGAKPGGGAIVAAKELPGVVVDDSQAKRVGDWMASQYSKQYIGDGYLHDRDQGKGEKTLTFVPELPAAGRYEVRLAYTPGGNRTAKAPVTVMSADGEKTIYVNQQEPPPIDGRFISLGQFPFELNGQGFVIVSNEETTGHVIADAVQFLPLDAVAKTATADAKPGAGKPASTPAVDEKVKAAEAEVKRLEAELKQLVDAGPKRPMVMSVAEEKEVGDTRVHIRGLVSNLGETVPRGYLQVATYGSPIPVEAKQSGRRELGFWLASPDNPLPARVFANRLWHWMFGAGLVRTCDNFGVTGETPSHPELLDQLALQLIDDGWSTKALVRDIALSQAYRRSSSADSAQIAADPENRYLGRTNRRRLDAECLLDGLLSASGRIDLTLGGPLLKPGLSADYGYQHQTTRRAVYWPLLRNALPQMLEVFDLADPSLVTGRRNVSTVAPQALFLMNDPLVLSESKAAAARLATEAPDPAARLELAYRRVLGRAPDEGERRASMDYLQAHGDAGWPSLVQMLFASLDYRYLD